MAHVRLYGLEMLRTFCDHEGGVCGGRKMSPCNPWRGPFNTKSRSKSQRSRSHVLGAVFAIHFSSVQSLSHVRLFVTPWTAADQASLSITNSWSLFKLMSIESVIPSNHLILCRPLLLLPSIFPSIRVFSHESVLCIRWPKYWRFSFSISPSKEYSGLISFRMDWLDLLAVQETLKSLLQPTLRVSWVSASFA